MRCVKKKEKEKEKASILVSGCSAGTGVWI